MSASAKLQKIQSEEGSKEFRKENPIDCFDESLIAGRERRRVAGMMPLNDGWSEERRGVYKPEKQQPRRPRQGRKGHMQVVVCGSPTRLGKLTTSSPSCLGVFHQTLYP